MRFIILLIVCSFTLASCGKNETHGPFISEKSDVKPGVVIDSSLKKHQIDTFKVNLKTNALVYGYADQKTVDAIVEVFGPDKQSIAFFDGPARGPENFQFRTSSDGIYKIVVRPFEENEGKYSLLLSNVEALSSDPVKQIEQLVALATRNDTMSPGASVAVAKDDKIIFSKGYGYADLEQEAKITPQTIFHIASVSKQFTAFSIAMLADQGKLSINDDIRKYLPELHDFGTPITINHLIHHTSGLRDQWNLLAMAGWRLDDVITQKQIMRMISRQRDLNFKPGDESVYCNTGYTLMAEIVSRVTGKSFPEWTKENIFQPLGMKNTFFYNDHEKIVKNRAYSYQRFEQGYKKSVLSYATVGATSLFTTVEDLSLWAMNFEKPKVGNEHVMQLMHQRFVLNKGDTISYAFGQVIGKYKGLKTVSHGGGDAGYRTFLLRFPDEHFSVSVFSNLASFDPAGLSFQIADMYLHDKLVEEKPRPRPTAPEVKKTPFDASKVKLKDFAGVFYSPELETTYTFNVENDTLRAHHQRHDDIKLTPIAPDGFSSSAWFLGDVTFTRDKAQRITGLKAGSGRVKGVVFNKM